MKRRRSEAPPADAPPPRANPLVIAWRFVQTVVVVGAILYVAALVLSRTAGFRTLVEERLARELEARVEVGSGRLTPGLDVVLDDLRLVETGSVSLAQAQCKRAIITWHMPRPFGSGAGMELSLTGAKVAMAWQGGQWHPRAFSDASDMVASWLQIQVPGGSKKAGPKKVNPDDLLGSATQSWPVWTGPRVKVNVVDGHLEWRTGGALPAGEVVGLRLIITPLDVPERKMTHYLLEARQVSAHGEALAAPLRLESLDAGGQQVMLGMMAGQAPAASAPR